MQPPLLHHVLDNPLSLLGAMSFMEGYLLPGGMAEHSKPKSTGVFSDLMDNPVYIYFHC